MEKILNSEFYTKKNEHSLNNIYKTINKANNPEESKEKMINSRKLLNNKFRYRTKCNLLLKPMAYKNGRFNSMIGDYSEAINKLKNQSLKQKIKPIDDISKDILDSTTHKFNILKRNSSFINNLKGNPKKIEFNRPLQKLRKNKSSGNIFDTINQILPMIRPRKILINIYSGPYEYKIRDINKKTYSYKKFGKNSFYMGDKYNPDNYSIEEKMGRHRNFYGKVFAN